MRPPALVRHPVSTLLSGLVAAVILAPSAHAADCVATTVVAPPQADAWVDANSFLANKGSDAVLNVGDTTRALVRFTLPPAVPEGCVVESARLRLYADSGTEGTRVEALALALAWSENAVTWSTQPPAVGPAAAAWSRDGYMQWNVTSLVGAMLEGTHHGFLLRDAGEGTENAGGHGFYAREKGENPPQLLIRFAAPPSDEPAPPAPPTPAAVRCGQLVTESTRVTNDLSDCPGDGLAIGADRIILDLGGHTVDGVGLGTGVRNEGYASVTMRNGTVQEFDRGVELLEETRRNLVEDLHVRHNEVAAIELFDAGGAVDGNEIRDNAVDDNGGGILLTSGTNGTVVSDNTLTLNSGAALLLRDADGNRLEDNRVVGGGDLGVGLERATGNVLLDTVVSGTSDGGIEIHDGSHGNRVERSTVTEAGDTGILVDASDSNELIANTALGMSDSGISLNSANDGIVRGNEVGGNPGGIQIDGSSRNLVEGNDASGGGGIGIELGGGSYANTLVANTASRNSAQGFYVADEALLEPGNTLYRNTADDNGSDGITVAKGGHTLTANMTRGNRGWGISTVGINVAERNMAAGNLEPAQCLGIVCAPPDVTPPETAIDDAPDAVTSSATATFELSADEPFATFECALDGARFAACSSPSSYTGLAEGKHELQVRATDEAGNTDATSAVHVWTVDTTPPETTIDTPDTAEDQAGFTFSADEPGSTFECALDTSGFQPCSSPAAYTGLSAGEHTFQARATDAAGNTDPTPASHTWTIAAPPDTTPPQTRIDVIETAGETAGFTFSADEPGSTFECSLDDAPYTRCASPARYSDLTVGEHTFQARATDAAGNTDPTPASHTWTIAPPQDTTPPQTTIDTADTVEDHASFTFSADEPGSSFECALDESGFEPCGSPAAYTGLSAGEHAFQVRATDPAGNTDPTPARHTWTIAAPPDTTPPQTTIDIIETSGETASFTFSADEPGSSFECALDTSGFQPCSSPAAYTGLSAGEHSFQVRATDPAGNTDPTPARHTWTIAAPPDTTPPQTTIDIIETSGETASFTFSADEPGASFECALDTSGFQPCSSPAAYTGLSAGEHSFQVRATDPAGNTDPTPARHTWTIAAPPDTTPPQTTIDIIETSGESAGFTFSADEPGSSFECALDDVAYTRCESPARFLNLSLGEHTLQVRATDAAGNTDPTPARHNWTIAPPPDTTPPQTTIDAADTVEDRAGFTFSADEPGTFECSLDDARYTRCESPARYSDLTVGAHSFQVRATDEAGNTDPTPARHDWAVRDTAAPQTTIDSGPDEVSSEGTALLRFSADEPGSVFECALDDGAFAPCESPAEYTGLGIGEHRFQVRATDPAGNTDATPATYAWRVIEPPDVTPPDTAIDSGPRLETTDRTATFTFSADEAATFECALDGAAFSPCTSPAERVGLGLGEHRFLVRATDAAGNTDATPASHAWVIVTPAPACVPRTVVAAAGADSWLLQSSPTSNYGGDSDLKIDTKAGANARAVLRFTLPPLPAGCRVTGARLRLYAGSFKAGRALEAIAAASAWLERGVTWSNQPATTGPAATALVPDEAGYLEWPVASQVQAMYQANHGFVLRDRSEDATGIEQVLHSREKGGDNPPELVISFG